MRIGMSSSLLALPNVTWCVGSVMAHSVPRNAIQVIDRINVQRNPPLAKVGKAVCAVRLLFGSRQSRQQHRSQYCDDRNNNEEFNQRERFSHPAIGWKWSWWHGM